MDTVIDRVLVRRVVALIAVHVRDGAIPPARLRRAFEVTGVDPDHQRAVKAGLEEIGVTVGHDRLTVWGDRSASGVAVRQVSPG